MTAINRLVPFRYPSGHRGVVTLRYDNSDPLATILDFGMDLAGNDIQWAIGRDVLTDGLTRHAGEGAVHCWACTHWFHVRLHGVDVTTQLPKTRTMRLDLDEVRAFLIDTEDLVPYGAESADFDAELSKLLIGGP